MRILNPLKLIKQFAFLNWPIDTDTPKHGTPTIRFHSNLARPRYLWRKKYA